MSSFSRVLHQEKYILSFYRTCNKKAINFGLHKTPSQTLGGSCKHIWWEANKYCTYMLTKKGGS